MEYLLVKLEFLFEFDSRNDKLLTAKSNISFNLLSKITDFS